VLIVEVDGTPGAVEEQARAAEEAARANHVRSVRTAADAQERAQLWKGRKNALGSLGTIAPQYYLHDVVVPRTRLVEAVSGFYEIGRRHGLTVSCMLHAGDGNLHPHLHFDQREPGALERVLAASAEVVRLAVEVGGSLTGEHGIGLEKRDFMPLVFTEEDLRAQACVRAAFDPDGRMNPAKVLPDAAGCGERRWS
jgi:glycolate oxidase